MDSLGGIKYGKINHENTTTNMKTDDMEALFSVNAIINAH